MLSKSKKNRYLRYLNAKQHSVSVFLRDSKEIHAFIAKLFFSVLQFVLLKQIWKGVSRLLSAMICALCEFRVYNSLVSLRRTTFESSSWTSKTHFSTESKFSSNASCLRNTRNCFIECICIDFNTFVHEEKHQLLNLSFDNCFCQQYLYSLLLTSYLPNSHTSVQPPWCYIVLL